MGRQKKDKKKGCRNQQYRVKCFHNCHSAWNEIETDESMTTILISKLPPPIRDYIYRVNPDAWSKRQSIRVCTVCKQRIKTLVEEYQDDHDDGASADIGQACKEDPAATANASNTTASTPPVPGGPSTAIMTTATVTDTAEPTVSHSTFTQTTDPGIQPTTDASTQTAVPDIDASTQTADPDIDASTQTADPGIDAKLCTCTCTTNVHISTQTTPEAEIHPQPQHAQAHNIITSIRHLTDEELVRVSYAIGQHIQKDVIRDINSLTGYYRDIDDLSNIDINKWVTERNSVVVGFVKGTSQSTRTNQNMYLVGKAVEAFYAVKNSNIVLPLSFAENITCYSVARSKFVTEIHGAGGAGGHYSTTRTWLKTQAKEELPNIVGDVVISFDNDQVVGKTYHVRADNKVTVSIVTAVCCATIAAEGTLQQQEKHKPCYWQPLSGQPIDDLNANLAASKQKAKEIHEAEVKKTIGERLLLVCNELMVEDGTPTDRIDQQLAHQQRMAEFGKVCPICRREYGRRKLKCLDCVGQVLELIPNPHPAEPSEPRPKKRKTVRQELLKDGTSMSTTVQPANAQSLYSHIQHSHPLEPVPVTPRDPVFCNPNSYLNIIRVFKQIGHDLNIQKYISPSSRCWAVLVCDGLPYVLGQKVIEQTFSCHHCKATIFKTTCMTKHMADMHPEIKEPSVNNDFSREFDWILLRIGYGHFEMNSVRSFMGLNWHIFGRDLAVCMSFKSPNAQKYAKACSDHHKSWELMRILYLGTIDELLLPYARNCFINEIQPTVNGFLEWKETVQNPGYTYMYEQIMVYLHSIMMLRAGLRRNNSDYVNAARWMYGPIFHARNHPFYQEIEMREALRCASQPLQVQAFMERTQSVSIKGDINKGEDHDFTTEGVNQRSKVWTHGTPTEEDWLMIFRNLDKLEKLREQTLKRMGVKDPKENLYNGTTHEPAQSDVEAWRLRLRESNYLAPSVSHDTVFSSMSGEELPDSLLNLTATGMWRRDFHLRKMFGGEVGDREECPPVFASNDELLEYNDITTKTKDVIISKVNTLLEEINDSDVRYTFEEDWRVVKRKTKPKIVDFYNKLSDMLALQGPPAANQDSDSGEDDL